MARRPPADELRRGARGRRALLTAIAAAWAASLALPAVAVHGGPTLDGLDLLLRGWEGTSRGVLAWIANPLFVAALVAAALDKDRAALAVSGAAVALGATSFGVEGALRHRMTSVPEIDLLAGFYLWLLALVALCLYSLARVLSSRPHARGRR